jgi:hypothetical protein
MELARIARQVVGDWVGLVGPRRRDSVPLGQAPYESDAEGEAWARGFGPGPPVVDTEIGRRTPVAATAEDPSADSIGVAGPGGRAAGLSGPFGVALGAEADSGVQVRQEP